MIIETLTGFTAGKFVWETLEILHLIHVGHITINTAHKGGSSIVDAIQTRLHNWEDKTNPGRRSEREAKTPYDFMAIDDSAYKKIKEEADQYLTNFGKSFNFLNNAERFFSEVYNSLIQLVGVKDDNVFSRKLSAFNTNFKSFEDEFKQFLSSIKIPPRELLYIADLSNQGSEAGEFGVIQKFNGYLKDIKTCINNMEEIRNKMSGKLEDRFVSNPTSLNISQQLQDSAEQLLAIMPLTLQEDKEYRMVRTAIFQISAAFQRTNLINERTKVWIDHPKWLPLLNEKKQIEAGQRIFIDAMSNPIHTDEEKLLLAEVFLRQHVSNYTLNQATIDLFAHQLANCLRVRQFNECKKQIALLKALVPGDMWPKSDSDELVEWLKTKRKEQSVNDLFIKVFVSPCLFSQTSLESALPKLKDLLWNQSINQLIPKYKESYWGAIREKNDALVQLPKSFKSKILKRDSIVQDTPAENSHVISEGIHDLAKKLITDLEMLTKALQTDHACLQQMVETLSIKEKDAFKVQQDQEHEKGVARVKKCHRYINSIKYETNSLFPYLYNAKTINEDEKKNQVPTIDDLFYVIYKGVDPNGICAWKHSFSQPYSESDQLVYYFLENQQDESLIKAFFYAVHECQASSASLFSHSAFSLTRPLLVSETRSSSSQNTAVSADNILSLDVILKYPKKILPIPPESQALKEVSPKTRQEAETAFKQLQDYQVFALTRMTPRYIKKLPFIQQLKYSITNLFKSTLTSRQEHLESVQTFISDLCAVFSAEDTHAIGRALETLQRDYDEKHEQRQQAQKSPKSVLYTTMQRLMKGPIAELSRYFPVQEPTPVQQPENPVPKQEKLIEVEQSHHKTQQKQEDLETQVEELKKELAQNNAKWQEKLEQKDAECQEKIAQNNAECEKKLEQKDAECQEKIAQNDAKWQEKIAQNNAEWEEALKENIAQNNAECEKKLEQKNAGWVTKFSQLFTSVTEPALDSRSTTASNEERSENSHNTRFFKS